MTAWSIFMTPRSPVFTECDSSGAGIGAVLLEPDSDHVESDKNGIPCNLRPVPYDSKSLTEAKHRCTNIEHELLAVLFSVEHFKHFVYARDVTIITDHKPLLAVFRWFKFTPKQPNRITHDKLRLAIWDTSTWTFWLKFGANGPWDIS